MSALPPDARRLLPQPPAARLGFLVLLALAGLGLALHVRTYAFLCDDAFISFRYARNLAHGLGLVFNPGFERVEGYSNFLWVLVLAAGARLGADPAKAALPISWLLTGALWVWVAAFALRRARSLGLPAWSALVAPFLLAASRSFAVWSSSGLETRGFELFAVGGAMRLVDEVDADLRGAPRRALAPWLFALATLMRPDGLLLAAACYGAACAFLAAHRKLDLMRVVRNLAPIVLLAGGLFAFRRAYYGAWLPNTYYAKIGGRTWWDAGARYFAAFALEYAAYLWIPFVAAGVVACFRRRAAFEPLLYASLIVPHALYVAAIGGDHFEYRPLGLYLPPIFLMAGFGAGVLSGTRIRGAVVAACVVFVALAGFELPWQSHRQFPDRYLPGFPGGLTPDAERVTFLSPDRDLIHRLPVFRSAARAHLALLRELSRRFIGIRQEEHARFLATVLPEGERLRELVARGDLPADTHLATGAVGAIPYVSNLRTLDRLGLTDAVVAHSAPQQVRVMAHDRSASFEYGRDRGVDLWAADDVHFLWHDGATHPLDLVTAQVPFWTAEVGGGDHLVVLLPRGIEETRRRFPRLQFVEGTSDSFLGPYFERGIATLRDSVRRKPEGLPGRISLAYFLMLRGDYAAAGAEYDTLLARNGEDPLTLLYASDCRAELGHVAEARAGLERALALAGEIHDARLTRRIARRLETLGAAR